MQATVYGKQVQVDDRCVKAYEDFFNTPFTNDTALYLAESMGCTQETTAAQLQAAIEKNIREHFDIYEDASRALEEMKEHLPGKEGAYDGKNPREEPDGRE